MSRPLDPAWLDAARNLIYHRSLELSLRSEEDALRFVEQVGFAFLFPVQGIELPNLWDAINGRRLPVVGHIGDRAMGLLWDWKDSLPCRRLIYYGKLLKRKPTLVSLEMLPYFYALSDNSGDADDYLESYRDGKLSDEGKRIYEALLEHGPQPTSRLRVLSGLPGKTGASRFDRGIAELQSGLYIVKSGISDSNAWKYCYVYDLLTRQFPEAVDGARSITGKQARAVLALRYLRSVVAASPAQLARIFDWSPILTGRVVDGLIAADAAEHAALPGCTDGFLRAKPT